MILTLALVFGQIARAATAKLWFDHCLYEALICVAEGGEAPACEAETRALAWKAPLGSKKLHVKLEKQNGNWHGQIIWEGAWGLNARTQAKLALR
jgi:hypothetical protein